MAQVLDKKNQILEKQMREDLDVYLNYIGYRGERKPNLETLRALQVLHTELISFENLNPLLKYPVSLEIDKIMQKICLDARGGYCFEQNALFLHILKLLGYNIKGLAARVLWNLPEGVLPARGHMLLLVGLVEEGPFIVDVGFGGLSLTGPLKLEINKKQPTPHESFRIIEGGDSYVLQAEIHDQWKPLYTFSLLEQLPQDYEAPNWYLSNHPNSFFTFTLIAARTVPGKRYGLRNNEFSIHVTNGPSEKKIITDAKELKELLVDVFKINIEGLVGLDEKLEEIVIMDLK